MAVGYELLRTGPGEDVEDELDQPIRLRRDGSVHPGLEATCSVQLSRMA